MSSHDRAASKPMSTLRGKSKARYIGKLEERGNKPSGPTWLEWQPVDLWAH